MDVKAQQLYATTKYVKQNEKVQHMNTTLKKGAIPVNILRRFSDLKCENRISCG